MHAVVAAFSAKCGTPSLENPKCATPSLKSGCQERQVGRVTAHFSLKDCRSRAFCLKQPLQGARHCQSLKGAPRCQSVRGVLLKVSNVSCVVSVKNRRVHLILISQAAREPLQKPYPNSRFWSKVAQRLEGHFLEMSGSWAPVRATSYINTRGRTVRNEADPLFMPPGGLRWVHSRVGPLGLGLKVSRRPKAFLLSQTVRLKQKHPRAI